MTVTEARSLVPGDLLKWSRDEVFEKYVGIVLSAPREAAAGKARFEVFWVPGAGRQETEWYALDLERLA